MAGRQSEEPPRGPHVCEVCAEEWPSSRALAGHIKVHNKGKAPMVPIPSVPPPPAFGPGPSMVPAMPRFFLPPPPAPPVLALGMGRQQAVAPAAGLFLGGMRRRPALLELEPRVQLRQLPQAPPRRDPVVYVDAGGSIRMVLLYPNPAFWAAYRMGMDDAPVEMDFMGLRPRPESPSPSFASWLNNA